MTRSPKAAQGTRAGEKDDARSLRAEHKWLQDCDTADKMSALRSAGVRWQQLRLRTDSGTPTFPGSPRCCQRTCTLRSRPTRGRRPGLVPAPPRDAGALVGAGFRGSKPWNPVATRHASSLATASLADERGSPQFAPNPRCCARDGHAPGIRKAALARRLGRFLGHEAGSRSCRGPVVRSLWALGSRRLSCCCS
jgi:hypothetical protein